MRVLGIDPGTKVTGYGILEDRTGSFSVIAAGEVRTASHFPISKRLKQIFDGLCILITESEPQAMALEEPFLARNFRAALNLGQACGIALLAAEIHRIPVRGYTPSEIKQAVSGYGTAGKDQVRRMVERLVSFSEAPTEKPWSLHVSDALAVAICHLHSWRFEQQVQGRA